MPKPINEMLFKLILLLISIIADGFVRLVIFGAAICFCTNGLDLQPWKLFFKLIYRKTFTFVWLLTSVTFRGQDDR